MIIKMNPRVTPIALLFLLLLVAGCQGQSTEAEPTVDQSPPPTEATEPGPAATPEPEASASPTAEQMPTAEPELPTPEATAEADEGEGSGAGGSNTPEPGSMPDQTAVPVATITVPPESRPAEARLITSPLPGAFVTSPLIVEGEADPAFEQTVLVRLITAEGDELALEPVIIDADVGQRGPVRVEIPFAVEVPTQAMVQLYSESPMDGAIDHLSSVVVVLASPEMSPSEGETIANADLEKIWIQAPANGETISGGVLSVEGTGLASFEQTLVASLTAEDGTLLGEAIITVQSAELGQAGPFSAEISYEVSETQTARLTVRDESPMLNETAHLSSILVTLEP